MSEPPSAVPPKQPTTFLETLLGSAQQPKSLEEEIQRLVRHHGWEAVAKASKRLAKPNRRRDLEREDFKVLGHLLQEDVERELRGLPTRSNGALANAALPLVRKTCPSSGLRRLMDRLASHRRKHMQAILKIEHAAEHYPCSVIYDACQEGLKVEGVENLANRYLDELSKAITDLDRAGQPVTDDPPLAEIRERAMRVRIAVSTNTYAALGAMMKLRSKG